MQHCIALQVTAGTVNYEGPITIRATSTGTDSTLAGIGRLVADAQAREAPVQRLADAVAGKFCYSVMAASAATFAFWSLAGHPCSTLLHVPAWMHRHLAYLCAFCWTLGCSCHCATWTSVVRHRSVLFEAAVQFSCSQVCTLLPDSWEVG